MRILPDEQEGIEEELIRLSDLERCDLVLTTGGTGFSLRDVTPEATLAVSNRDSFDVYIAHSSLTFTDLTYIPICPLPGISFGSWTK